MVPAVKSKFNYAPFMKLFGVTLIILLINYYVTYGTSLKYSSFFYNFIKLSVYAVLGYITQGGQIKNFLPIVVLGVIVFFTEHVLFRIFHLALAKRLYALDDVSPILFGSFLLFIPVVVLLLYIGRVIRQKVESDKWSQTP